MTITTESEATTTSWATGKQPPKGYTPIGEWRRACAMAALTRAVAAAARREDEGETTVETGCGRGLGDTGR